MIFVTVGAQMSFDRLVGWMDDWAERRDRGDVIAQIGPSDYAPLRLRVVPFMTPPEFRDRLVEAEIVVSHAGMGSIINALELGKPILVVPRHGDLGETRNDHQVATARRFSAEGLVRMADSPQELDRGLETLIREGAEARIAAEAQPELLARMRAFATGPRGSQAP